MEHDAKKEMRLVINADDFSLSRAVNCGIIEAHRKGVVTSTTALVNVDAFMQCYILAKQNPNLSVGIHLNITLGRSLLFPSSLVDDNGVFFPKTKYVDDFNLDVDDLYKEWKLQIERFIQVMKIKPTHMDSHHHIHLLAKVLPIARRLSVEYNLPLRGDIELCTTFYGKQVNSEFFSKLPSYEKLEIMVHPAFVDTPLLQATSYAMERLKEFDILINPLTKTKIEQLGYILVNYKEVM